MHSQLSSLALTLSVFPFISQAKPLLTSDTSDLRPRADSPPGQKPILGYNSYNDVACSPSNAGMMATIKALSDKGLLAAGYKYFQIDCGWQGYDRLANGSITYDAANFPNGIKPLSDYARSLGFKWSMYTDQGVYACDTRTDKLRPGSLGHEHDDALMFAAWNTEYVKVDNCYISGSSSNAPKDPRTDFVSRYSAMWNALKSVNINEMLICQWGVPYQTSTTSALQAPFSWAPSVSTSYRLTDDIASGWTNMLRIYNQAHYVVAKGQYGPGKLFDMDLLEVGNAGMTFDEQKTHFAIWAASKSALMISTNVPNMSSQTLSIFLNKDLIDINQDSLGTPIKIVQRFSNDYDIFSGPLSNGDKVIVLVDHSNTQKSRTISLTDLGIAAADVKDIWAGATSTAVSSFTQTVPAHGSIVLRLSNIKAACITPPTYTYYAAASATLSGSSLVSCSGCSAGQKIGSVGNGRSFTISGIRTSKATSDVLFDYINCEISWLGTSGTNVRSASISVNGGSAVTVLFPLSGYDWSGDVLKGWKARLSGFNTNGDNTITVSNANAWAPDFDRIGVVA